jgi:outer membrane protein assembly factor BamB
MPPGTPALTPRGSWPPRFDAQNTGWNPDGTGLHDGTTAWRLNAGGPASVAGGTLYNTAGRNRTPTALTYRDPATARVTTRRDLVEYGVNPPPVVVDGYVFVTTFIEVFCFDAATGEQLWRGPAMNGIRGQPTVHDGQVVVATGGFGEVSPQLRAFDAATGEQLWRYASGAFSESTPAVGDGQVFVSSTGGLHALDRATGAESFAVPEVATRRSSPVVADGTVFALAATDAPTSLVALAATDGTERWRVPVAAATPPVVTDVAVYAAVDDGIAKLDRADGRVLAASAPVQAEPVGLVGDTLYATGDGTVHALAADGDLATRWSLTTADVRIDDTVGRRIYHVTPVDGAVYVSARDAFYGLGSADQ